MNLWTRRAFLAQTMTAAGTLALPGWAAASKMRFGLVTYLWGQDWDLPTLIANCEATGALGVELRIEHAHAVEPSLSKEERDAVRKRFADSTVECLGMGTNQQFDMPNERALARSIEGAKEYIQLSHDIGATGIKVKPNTLHDTVPREQTIEQIGKALNEIGKFGADLGQEIRLEVHGKHTSDLPVIKAIMDVADHPSVGVCWNSNDEDLAGDGLEHNFNLVKGRFGRTVHVRELDLGDYPYQNLMNLLVGMNYDGWVLLEARTAPEDRVAALKQQREIFEAMVTKASA